VPIANLSLIFASISAVMFLVEAWVLENVIGALLVVVGVVGLSMAKPAKGEWSKVNVVYPLIGALAFGASSTLRKAVLGFINIPLLSAAVTAGSAAIFSFTLLQIQGGKLAFKLTRRGAAWLFPPLVSTPPRCCQFSSP
jgi:drug/metabolite transporter (DMT)-like permease